MGEPGTLAIMEAAWPALDLFLRCDSQWRFAGMDGIPVGLDFAAVAAIARGLRVKLTPETVEDLLTLEAAARSELMRRRRKT